MPHTRRFFLKQSLGWLGLLLPSLWFKSAKAEWLAEHFGAAPFEQTLQRLFAGKSLQESDLIRLKVPEIAEDGAVVPVSISSDLPDIRRLYLLVEKNPTPLAAEFELGSGVVANIGARIKMAESCHVIVVAEQGVSLLTAQQWVRVMQGGCGTG